MPDLFLSTFQVLMPLLFTAICGAGIIFSPLDEETEVQRNEIPPMGLEL